MPRVGYSFVLRWRLWLRWRRCGQRWHGRRVALGQLYRLWECIRAEYGEE